MRDKIWYEMVHCKFGDYYLAHLIDRQRETRKWFKIFTLIFSTSGVLGWKVWDYAPILACGLIATMQLISLIENQIVPMDKDIDNTADLRNKYNSYFNKLEKFWIYFNSKKLDDLQATDQFYKLRQIGTAIQAADNKLHIRRIQSLCNKANTETRNYFNQYHS